MTGADIRRYRRALAWNQKAFAEHLGISQSALSMLEAGRIAVSEDHIQQLKSRFDSTKFKPRFSDFLKTIDAERSVGQAAISSGRSRFLTLTVWDWEEGMDLSQEPSPEFARGLVTVSTDTFDAIAFRLPRASAVGQKGEVIVFERCLRGEIEDGELCLVQVKPARSRTARTIIATAHLAPSTPSAVLQLEPLSPAGPIFTPDDETVLAYLRAIYRGLHLR